MGNPTTHTPTKLCPIQPTTLVCPCLPGTASSPPLLSPCDFLLQFHGVRRVELHPEAQHQWVDICRVKDRSLDGYVVMSGTVRPIPQLHVINLTIKVTLVFGTNRLGDCISRNQVSKYSNLNYKVSVLQR